MFFGCSALSYIKCLAEDISASYSLYCWVDGVFSEGTFVKAPSMNDWPQGIDGIPEGWTVLDNIQIPEAVDLGLSVKWASFNLGASKPEEYGDYYAWGENEPKENYSWETYKWCGGGNTTMTKYCTNSTFGYNGFVDNKTGLDTEDDAAYAALGGKWRMPTDEEWTALRTQCTWSWTTQNGVSGQLITASNGSSIFLPSAGFRNNSDLCDVGSYGIYWSSSLYSGNPGFAYYVGFNSEYVYRTYISRYCGQSVRPVFSNSQ